MNATVARAPNSALPQILTKITARDMSVVLPRLDTSVDFDDQPGVTDPAKKKRRDELIEKWAEVYTIGGLLVATKGVKGKDDKEGIRFIGQFKAQLAAHLGGKWFASSRCHLPVSGEELLYTAFTIAKKKDADTVVQFLFAIGIKPPNPDKPSMTGYEWTVRPLVDMGEAQDPVQALFERAQAVPRQLAALVGESGASAASTLAETVPAAAESVASRSHGRRGATG